MKPLSKIKFLLFWGVIIIIGFIFLYKITGGEFLVPVAALVLCIVFAKIFSSKGEVPLSKDIKRSFCARYLFYLFSIIGGFEFFLGLFLFLNFVFKLTKGENFILISPIGYILGGSTLISLGLFSLIALRGLYLRKKWSWKIVLFVVSIHITGSLILLFKETGRFWIFWTTFWSVLIFLYSLAFYSALKYGHFLKSLP